MSHVIVYTNENGWVSVCLPTGEVPIEDVLAKNCPSHAIIIDSSTLPQGADTQFFESWRLTGTTITIDLPTAVSMATKQLNTLAYTEFQHRNTKTGIGLTNVLSDEDWTTVISAARTAIAAAQTTTDLVTALDSVKHAIQENAI